jgi:diguanylate cyclase (GGDEF)-like protein/PAS domain S-box-containing protein
MSNPVLAIEIARSFVFILAFGGFLWLNRSRELGDHMGLKFFILGFILSILAEGLYLAMLSDLINAFDWMLVIVEMACHLLGMALVFIGLLIWFFEWSKLAKSQRELLRLARESEEALRIGEARYRGVVENQTEFISRFLPDGTLTFVNDALCRYVGKSQDELLGRRFFDFIPDEEGKKSAEHLYTVTPDNPTKSNTHRAVMPDGRVLWTQWTQRAIFDENGRMVEFQSVGRDITRQKKMEEELRRLSLQDSLTGMANRAFFEREMEKYEGQASVGLMIFDLDGLKLANDTLGHSFGDELLLNAARLISSCCKNGETVSRIGGDEFAVLFKNATEESMQEFKQRIESVLEECNQISSGHLLSFSMGFALKRNPEMPMAQLFKEADNSMYREKLYSSRRPRSNIIRTLARALETKDFIAAGHAERLQGLLEATARSMGLPQNAINGLRLLAQVHDVGKVGIPDDILFKVGPLNEEEVKEIRRHCEIGHRIALSSPDLAPIAEWILTHHEWWNGKGYPLGLQGDEIPVECRLFAIADAYDAMTSERPYRHAQSVEYAITELRRHAGSQFDPKMVEEFIKVVKPSISKSYRPSPEIFTISKQSFS